MFWTSGNDVDLEGDWVWTEGGGRKVGRKVGREVGRVGSKVWLQSPSISLEENCLVWSITRSGRSGVREGGLSEACCTSSPYICRVS